MKQITYFTANSNQSLVINLDDGTSFTFSLRFYANQLGWFYTLTYGNFIRNNRRIVLSPNMLRAYRNILPFGIAIVSTDGYEPTYLDDFSTGRVCFYVLDSLDVLNVENNIFFKEVGT